MKQLFFITLCILLFSSQFVHSQIKPLKKSVNDKNILFQNDSITNNDTETIYKLSGKTVYTDYRIISFKKDTTYIDTTLTILKEYKNNYLRKDNFELLAFHHLSCFGLSDFSILLSLGSSKWTAYQPFSPLIHTT